MCTKHLENVLNDKTDSLVKRGKERAMFYGSFLITVRILWPRFFNGDQNRRWFRFDVLVEFGDILDGEDDHVRKLS